MTERIGPEAHVSQPPAPDCNWLTDLNYPGNIICMDQVQTFTSFAGSGRIATGDLHSVLLQTKAHIDGGNAEPVLVFDDSTGQQIDFDLSGGSDDVLERLSRHPHLQRDLETRKAGPGRPKLGVVCREISLLPRHWEWLERQPQGVSAAVRRLVDEARKRDPEGERLRAARDAAAKFMWIMAGNVRGFEEASRALFAGDYQLLRELMQAWPVDVRDHVLRLLQ